MIRQVSLLFLLILNVTFFFAVDSETLSERMKKYEIFSTPQDEDGILTEIPNNSDTAGKNQSEKIDVLNEKALPSGEETFSTRLGKVDIPNKFKLTEITIGKKDAEIHLIIYSSFTCPHCREFHTNGFPRFKKEYIDTGKVKVSFRCYLDDQGALESAQIVRCLSNESTDKYMFLYHEIYKHQVDWLKSKDPAKFLKNIFVNLGFNKKKVDKCLKRTDIAAGLMLEQKRAMHELGLLSMPAFLVSGKVHIGKISYEELVNLCGL